MGPWPVVSSVPLLSGMKNRILTDLAVLLSGANVPGLEDVVAIVIVAVVELLEFE